MDKMSKSKRLPKIPKDIVKPTIVTGVEALVVVMILTDWICS